MDCKKLQMEEKARALTLLEKGDSVIAVARDIVVSREAIYQLKRAAASLPTGMVPKRKCGSGTPKKTSPQTDKLLKQEVTSYLSITAFELKNKHPELLQHLNQDNSPSTAEGSWSTMLPCCQETHAHCSNEEEKV